MKHYSDGKDRSNEQKYDLEDLCGFDNNPFGTSKKDLFLNRLEHMSLEEKGNLACRAGVQITNNEDKLTERLKESFDKYISRSKRKFRIPEAELKKDLEEKEAYKNIDHLLGFDK